MLPWPEHTIYKYIKINKKQVSEYYVHSTILLIWKKQEMHMFFSKYICREYLEKHTANNNGQMERIWEDNYILL